MILYILLSSTTDNIYLALRIASALVAWIALFKVITYKRMLKRHIKNDIEERKLHEEIYSKQEQPTTTE